MQKYSREDLHSLGNSLEMIRNKPEMFAGEKPWGPNLASRLISDLMSLDAMPASVEKVERWWVVSSAKDWLALPNDIVSLEPFSKITRDLARGQFAIRTEVVIAALADAVVTIGSDGLTWITSEKDQWPLPAEVTKKAPPTGRTVAFKIDEP